MTEKLIWQHPTDWSMETPDGSYYIEKDDQYWESWRLGAKKEKLGVFSSLNEAKEACQFHYESF